MIHRKLVLLWGLLLIIALSGCFREAEDSSVAPTQREVRLADVQQQQTQNAPTRAATLRPTETREPIPIGITPTANKTQIIGGPPVSNDSDTTGAVAEAPTTAPTDVPTLTPEASNTPTPIVPTATPSITTVPPDVATIAPPSFGDTGISPTPSRTFTPVLETFLATPTDIAPEQDECIYLVQGGDTIFGIARDLDVTPEELYAVNPTLALNPDDLQIGQALQIPGCIPEEEATFPAASISITPNIPPTSTTGDIIHVVESGDTLFGIALEYGVSVEDIVAANESLINENTPIFPGDELIIPR